MPVKPSESRALIPEANTPTCPKVIRNFIALPTLVDRIVSDIWNEDGTVTDAFKAAIGLTVGGLAAPTNVVATNGVGTSVSISWSPVTGASSYTVFRGLENNSATATTQIGPTSDTTIVDSSGTSGQIYWYFLKASNAGGSSTFSSGDSGSWGATTGTPLEFTSTNTWTVPAGVSTIGITLHGDGGGGGSGNLSYPGVFVLVGGGGGGSGSKRVLSAIAVSVDQIITITIGTGGLPGGYLSNGGNGQGTSVATPSTNYATGGGGGGGSGGIQGVAGQYAGAAGVAGGAVATQGLIGNAGVVNAGGAGGAAVAGYGAGGAGGSPYTLGVQGSAGHVTITPNG